MGTKTLLGPCPASNIHAHLSSPIRFSSVIGLVLGGVRMFVGRIGSILTPIMRQTVSNKEFCIVTVQKWYMVTAAASFCSLSLLGLCCSRSRLALQRLGRTDMFGRVGTLFLALSLAFSASLRFFVIHGVLTCLRSENCQFLTSDYFSINFGQKGFFGCFFVFLIFSFFF